MKSNSLSALLQLVVAVMIVGGSFASAMAQNGVPVYITMKSGHRFDGVIDSVQGFSTLQVPIGSGQVTIRIDNGLRRVYVNKRNLADQDPIRQGFDEVEFEIWQDKIRPIRGCL